MSLRRRQPPHWVLRHKRSDEKLRIVLLLLQRFAADHITARQAKIWGMQFTPLDFDTGDTSSLLIPCFAPREDDGLLVKKTRCMLQRSNFFKCSLGTGAKYQNKTVQQRDGLLRSALVQSFKDYRVIANRNHKVPDLHSIEDEISLDGKIHHKSGKDTKIQIVTAHQLQSDDQRMRQNHQMVTISTNEDPERLPSTTDLQVLAILMRQAMVNEGKEGHFRHCRERHVQKRMTKYLFPTLVTTIYRGGYVRVIYGYMEDSLKIQYTEPRQVTVDNFETMMEKMLQWNMAETQGDPASVVTLPSITEEEEPVSTETTKSSSTQQSTDDLLQACKQRRSRPYDYVSSTWSGIPCSQFSQFHKCAFNSAMQENQKPKTKAQQNPKNQKNTTIGYLSHPGVD